MYYLFIAIGVLLAALMSWSVIPQIILIAFRKRLLDKPDDSRKIHTTATPRLGGVSFVPSIAFTAVFMTTMGYIYNHDLIMGNIQHVFSQFALMMCGLIVLYLMGIRDDLIAVPYRWKFAIQILAASFFPLAGLWINNLYGLFGIYYLTPWVGVPLTVLIVVFILNAMNLIDGIDGLASGLGCISLLVLGEYFVLLGVWSFALLAFVTAGVLLPFFYYNVFGITSKYKIFMGDTGSLTLGYILAFLAIRFASVNPSILPYTEGAIMIAFSTLLVPMLDVCRVILMRIYHRQHLFIADNSHIHHTFLKAGYTPRSAMIRILFIACCFVGLNIFLVHRWSTTVIFVTDIVCWMGLHLWLDLLASKKQRAVTGLKQTGSLNN